MEIPFGEPRVKSRVLTARQIRELWRREQVSGNEQFSLCWGPSGARDSGDHGEESGSDGDKTGRDNGRGNFRAGRDAGEAASGVRVPGVAARDGEDHRRSIPKAPARHHRSGDRYGQNAGVPDSSNSQRAARGGVHGDEVAAGAIVPEGRAFPAEAFRAPSEGRTDEGPK